MVLRYILGADIDRDGFESRVNGIRSPELQSTVMSLAEIYRQEGREEGREEGKQEDILDALGLRFGEVPGGLQEAVRQVRDGAKLRQLLRTAIQCGTLDDFAAAL